MRPHQDWPLGMRGYCLAIERNISGTVAGRTRVGTDRNRSFGNDRMAKRKEIQKVTDLLMFRVVRDVHVGQQGRVLE